MKQRLTNAVISGSLNYESHAASLFAALRGRAERTRAAVRACSHETGECKNVNGEAEMYLRSI